MEVGKYYIDGEGFYKVILKGMNGTEPIVIVDAVLCNGRSIASYKNIPYMEEACDRRMVEITEEVFNRAKEYAEKIIKLLDDYNTEVFKPLWDKKHFYKEVKALENCMNDMGKASEQVVAALKGVSDAVKEMKTTRPHSERSE